VLGSGSGYVSKIFHILVAAAFQRSAMTGHYTSSSMVVIGLPVPQLSQIIVLYSPAASSFPFVVVSVSKVSRKPIVVEDYSFHCCVIMDCTELE
jgi:hypothetical protein